MLVLRAVRPQNMSSKLYRDLSRRMLIAWEQGGLTVTKADRNDRGGTAAELKPAQGQEWPPSDPSQGFAFAVPREQVLCSPCFLNPPPSLDFALP